MYNGRGFGGVIVKSQHNKQTDAKQNKKHDAGPERGEMKILGDQHNFQCPIIFY